MNITSLEKEVVTGDGRTITLDDITQLYRDLVNQSIPTRGHIQRIGQDAYSITNQFKTTDCDTLEAINTFKIYSLITKQNSSSELCIDSVRCVSGTHEVNELLSATSENGRFLARLKSSTGSDTSNQLLQIWDRSKLIKTVNVSDLDIHGTINTDAHFTSFVWSPFGEQDKLLYICQPKRPKQLSFFKEQKSSSNQSNINRGDEYLRREDWGECLNGIEHTIVGVLDVSTGCQITTIDMKGMSLANAQWLDNGDKIVSVAYHEEPRRLGIIYCNNRRSSILVHDWKSSPTQPILEISSDKECYHSPRVNQSGNAFLYLGNPVFGAHRHAEKIYLHDLKTNTARPLVDRTTGVDEYFIQTLPLNCFSDDDRNILLNTFDNLHLHLSLYSLDQATMFKIRFPTTGVNVLDFRNNIILASGSELNATPTLFVGLLNTINTDDAVAWHQIEDCLHLHDVDYRTFEIPTVDNKSTVSAILAQPDLKVIQESSRLECFKGNKIVTDVNELPTVIIIHGGPHSAFSVNYSLTNILRCRLGLKTVLINYRGSLGVSEDYIRELSGRVGELDVGDCLHVIRYLADKEFINPKKLVIQGGSHGGFLACHLSCQDDFKFTSAVIRNPVVEVSSLYATSDIPDWAFNVSLGHKYHDFLLQPSTEDICRMYECSPLYKVSRADVPTLMLLGTKDRRVNMYQGERWVDQLKARGIETLCKVYDDEHSLGKVKSAADSEICAFLWILGHL